MNLTKDDDGLLIILEILIFFFSMWLKWKITTAYMTV